MLDLKFTSRLELDLTESLTIRCSPRRKILAFFAIEVWVSHEVTHGPK